MGTVGLGFHAAPAMAVFSQDRLLTHADIVDMGVGCTMIERDRRYFTALSSAKK
jgi:hypothetical protein